MTLQKRHGNYQIRGSLLIVSV